MVRLRLLLPLVLVGIAVTTITGCAGGGAHGSYLPAPTPTSGATPPAYSGPTAAATLTLTIPAPGSAPTATNRRSPAYLPASVRSVSILVLEVGGVAVADTAATTNVTPGTAPCSTVTSADYTCTISVQLPIGTDEIQLGTYDAVSAGGNLMSQTLVSEAVLEGHANQFGTSGSPITLDANPGAVTVTASNGETGSQSAGFSVNGTSAETYTLSVVDKHGTAFGSQPGQPAFNHAANSGCSGSTSTISSGTLTVTPSSSCTTLNVVADSDPAAATDVTATLTDSPASGATSFTVSITSGTIFIGQNLILDYENFSGSTLLQESVKVTGVSGSTITISPGLAHAHTSGAGVRHYGDNLSPSTAPFTVTLSQTVIAPVGINQSNDSKALVYNTSFSLQTGSLTSTTEGFSNARFDTADQLFILDQNLETAYRSQWTAGSGFGSVTTYSGIPGSQAGNIAFDVSSSGAVENFNENDSAGTVTPQLDAYAAGTSSSPTGFTSSLGASSWPTVTEFDYPTVAVLSDTSANVFGYAYEICDANGVSTDKIVVTSGTSEQDLTGSIVSMFANDPTAAVLTWDVGLQALFYANSDTGSGSTYAILEFAHTGSTDSATLSNSPTTIASVAGNPVSIASSQGTGDYVAVAWDNSAGGATISIYFYNGSTWSLTGTIDNNGTTLSDFTSMHFIPSGNLIVSNSDSGGTIGQLMEYTTTGTQVGSTYNALADFGSGYTINDVAVSY